MKHCLITGAADGIGKALAHRFAIADEAYAIIGVDIDADRAAQTQADIERLGGNITFIPANLASEQDIAHLLDQLAGGPGIDVLIHNAGISEVGYFANSAMARQEAVIRVNWLAPMLLTAGLLRHKKIVPGGSLVFMSSLSKFVGYPGAAGYAASKDGLASYARSLAVSLAGQGTHVLTVYPGPTRTAHARRYSPDNSREAGRMPPERLAGFIFQAVQKRKRTLIPRLGNQLFALAGLLFPALPERIMRKTILEKLCNTGA